MTLKKLTNTTEKSFGRGWVFRCLGKYPYEDIVDFMIREDPDSPSRFSMIVISGYKAGCTFQQLPKEAISDSGGISTEWLIQHWQDWVYPECPVEEVLYYRNEIANKV